nr:hypothetical protein [Tanacetum cinerariifolium]
RTAAGGEPAVVAASEVVMRVPASGGGVEMREAAGERRLVHVVSAAGLWQWGCGMVTGAWPESGRDMWWCVGEGGDDGVAVHGVGDGGSYRSSYWKYFFAGKSSRKNFPTAAVWWWPTEAGGWPAVVVAAGWEEGDGVFVCVLIYEMK